VIARGRKAVATAAAVLACVAAGAACQAESTYVPVPDEDKAMDAATEQARATLPVFWAKYDAAKPGETMFLVKVGMKHHKDGVEHIWMNVADHSDQKVVGYLANEPEYLDGLHAGSRVEADVADISDWAYGEDKLYGQYTTRVLLKYMSPAQRAEAMESLAATPLEPQSH
jgi:uncharacterized protein YegJ (DUF2314 family)